MPQKRMKCFRLLLKRPCMNRASVFEWHKDSRKAGSLWGMMRGAGGVRKSIHQSWLVKGLGLLCWGWVQEEIPSEEARTLQIGSVAFSSRTMHQSTIPYMSQTIGTRWASRQFLTFPIVQTLLPVTFWLFPKLTGCRRYERIEMKEAVTKVIDTLIQEDFHGAFQKLLERYNQSIAAGGDYFEGD